MLKPKHSGFFDTTLDTLLESQRFWTYSVVQEARRVSEYSAASAAFDHAQGLSLHRAHLVGSAEPLRSAKKERQR